MDTEVVFKALADGTRQHILQLAARQELGVSELVDCLRLPQSTVSRHLKVLRDAALIRDRREGNAVLYSAIAAESTSGNVTAPGQDPSPNARGGRPATDSLQRRLLDWVGEQELTPALSRRLAEVVTRRKSLSDAFFSRIGHRWDQMRIDAFGEAFHLEALTMLLPQHWSVVDIGTGTGYLLPTLARCFRNIIAVDPVPEMLDVARARCAAAQIENVDFREGDFSRVPVTEGHVDVALAVLVLHHVPSPSEALEEMFRIVKPGGRILVVEQQAHELTDFYERMQDHWWGFEAGTLSLMVEDAGFSDTRYFALAASNAADAPGLFALTASKTDN